MSNASLQIAPEQIMAWLEQVSDPEIPVISIIDLGIVRDVSWEEEQCVIAITPTYSGCPAMQEIAADIRSVLAAHGIDNVRIESRLSPAWTTDWMSEKGHAALKGYGIAPPGQKAINISGLSRMADIPAVDCPLCGSSDTRLVSQFGSTSCKALYRCRQCGEPFDYFKAH